jgi:UDP-N-acetylglucosamine enolpyruvyl transferase
MHLINIPTYHITQTHTILIQHFGATTTWDAPTRLEFGMIIATTTVSSSNIEYMMIKSTSRSALQLGPTIFCLVKESPSQHSLYSHILSS